MWAPGQMFPDRFGLHGSQWERLKRCWWRTMQSKRGGIRQWRKTWTVCVNVSPASLCIFTESFSWRFIMHEWWEVAREYQLINRCIGDAMNLLTRYMNFSRVRVNSARMLLRMALPQGQVSICDKDYQEVQNMMNTNINSSRCWMDNTVKWASTKRQRCVVL